MSSSLIIFVKNKVLGKVKTRISRERGNEDSLSVYAELLKITRANCENFEAVKNVYYSDFIEHSDEWDIPNYSKKIQEGKDLGERMNSAISNELKNANYIVLIGSDCPYLKKKHLDIAFKNLVENDVVIGPCTDGGYYLIGMKKIIPELFSNIPWSTDKVLEYTIDKIKKLNLKYHLLETLSDIDYWSDWEKYLEIKKLNSPQP